MTLDEYRQKYTDEDPVGWDCITAELEKIYSGEARHYAPELPAMLGGDEYLDGVSIYDSEKGTRHKHLVSYGMSSLYYNEDCLEHEYSKWGFEFTFRLKCDEGEGDPTWAVNLMQNLARYVNQTENWFEVNHCMPTNSPIRADSDTNLVAIVFTLDPELREIDTPHGKLTFLQMVGITSEELEDLRSSEDRMGAVGKLVDELRKDNPLLITELTRK